MKRLGLGLLPACLLLGCGASDDEALGPVPRYRIPGCEQYDTAPCDVRGSECQRLLLDIATCLRDAEPADLPPISTMTEAEYGAYLTGEQEDGSAVPPELEAVTVMLGLTEAGAFQPSAMASTLVENVWGFYRDDSKDIVIIDHGADSNEETASETLVHEFIHALQDRALDLRQFSEAHDETLDTELATRALVEGEARLHELRYAAAMLGLDPRRVDWTRLLQNRVDAVDAWILKQPSPLIAGELAFTYEWGARYLYFDWSSAGQAGISHHFSAPATTTHALLASTDHAASDDFEPAQPVLPNASASFTFVGDEVLGSFGMFLLLGKAAGLEQARALALGWRGDRLGIYRGPAMGTTAGAVPAFVWYADFDSEATAAAVASRLGVLPGGSPTIRVVGARVMVAMARELADMRWAFPAE